MRVELFEIIERSENWVTYYYIADFEDGSDIYLYSNTVGLWIPTPLELYLDERYKLVVVLTPAMVKLLGIEKQLPAYY